MQHNTDTEKATACQKTPTFNEALQSAKEAIGFFANGDQSFVANDAKRLWYCIDDVQQGKATNTQPHIASINGQLLEEIKHYKAQADKLAEALRKLLNRLDNITSDQFAHGAERIEREAARNVLAAYKSESEVQHE